MQKGLGVLTRWYWELMMHMFKMETFCSGKDNHWWKQLMTRSFPMTMDWLGPFFSVREALSDVELEVHAASSMASPKNISFQEI